MQKRIDPYKSFLIKFFRNLILDEYHELKNHDMLIKKTDDQTGPASNPSSSKTSKTGTDYDFILLLVMALGEKEMSVKDIMDHLHLKDWGNFMNVYLFPSIDTGYMHLLYLDSPRHL